MAAPATAEVTMAIISGFARADRVDEVAGCPLAAHAAVTDESGCSDCPYNALNPGHARMGCVLSTPLAAYQRCMAHLEAISRRDFQELQEILKRERETGTTAALSPPEVERLRGIAAKWWDLVGNDPAEQQLVTAMLRFCDASLAHHEPIKILA